MLKVKSRKPLRQKVCRFCADKKKYIDYKEITLLRRLISEKGKIKARRATGTCTQHQKAVAKAVKRARFVGLLPYKREKYR